MKKRSLAVVAATWGLSIAGHAQTAEPKWFAPQLEVSQIKAIGDAFGNNVVKGKPFSATEERHSVQVLANGTRIENTQSNRLYRDNDGRTRIDDMSGVIRIVDPVAGYRLELNPTTKVAQRSSLLAFRLNVLGNVVDTLTIYGKKIGDGRGSTAGARSPGDQAADSATASVRENEARLAQMQSQRAQTLALSKGGDTKSLGNQNVNGVWSQGTRTTVTIPKGQIGNDREIKVVTEQWFSNDLGLLVKSSNSDPRFGDTAYQLANIVQAPPDPSLFQIPADYRITGPTVPNLAPGQVGGRGGRGGRGAPAAQ
ncbi:MAG: hypothetical protein JO307_14775 [Bryobacterales bacterium]|nr:hypothetical protein [Bryobacterales bacterium]